MQSCTQMGSGEGYEFINHFVGDIWSGIVDCFFETVLFEPTGPNGPAADPNGMALSGIATRTASIVAGGDSDCFTLWSAGSPIANNLIWMNALGTAPYGFGGR